ncbi:unnamed protein product [Aspergillus oryzae]|nr:unnamed protein product [Aspergillus oryzae]
MADELDSVQSDTSIKKDPLWDQDGSCRSWDLSFSRSTPSSTSTRPSGTAENLAVFLSSTSKCSLSEYHFSAGTMADTKPP